MGRVRPALTSSELGPKDCAGGILSFPGGWKVVTAGIASSERRAGARSGSGRDRREDERFDLERAPGTLFHKGVGLPCEMLDISLSGCRLRTLKPFTAGALESVKVVLAIQEMVLSIWGTTQWTTMDRTIGVRFIHPTGRTRNQLAGLLTCLLDENAAEVVKKAVAEASQQSECPIIALEHPSLVELDPEVAEVVLEEEVFQEAPPPPSPRERAELRSEYKVLNLEEGDSPAVLQLVADGAVLSGNVLDVSQDGCLVQLARAFSVRLDAQAEVDFRLCGLPFRLPGMTREMHSERIVEIRFTEMSRRKQESLSQVIMEMHVLIEAGRAQAG